MSHFKMKSLLLFSSVFFVLFPVGCVVNTSDEGHDTKDGFFSKVEKVMQAWKETKGQQNIHLPYSDEDAKKKQIQMLREFETKMKSQSFVWGDVYSLSLTKTLFFGELRLPGGMSLYVEQDVVDDVPLQDVTIRVHTYTNNQAPSGAYVPVGGGFFVQIEGVMWSPLRFTLIHPELRDAIGEFEARKDFTTERFVHPDEGFRYVLISDEFSFSSHDKKLSYRKAPVWNQFIDREFRGLTSVVFPDTYFTEEEKSALLGSYAEKNSTYKKVVNLRLATQKVTVGTPPSQTITPDCLSLFHDGRTSLPLFLQKRPPKNERTVEKYYKHVPLFVVCGLRDTLKYWRSQESTRGHSFEGFKKHIFDLLLKHWHYYTGLPTQHSTARLLSSSDTFSLHNVVRMRKRGSLPYPVRIRYHLRKGLDSEAEVNGHVASYLLVIEHSLKSSILWYLKRLRGDEPDENCDTIAHEFSHYFIFWMLHHTRLSVPKSSFFSFGEFGLLRHFYVDLFSHEAVSDWAGEELCDLKYWRRPYLAFLKGQSSTIGRAQDEGKILHWRARTLQKDKAYVLSRGYVSSLFLRSLPFRENYLKSLFRGKIRSVFDYPFLPILGGSYHPSNFKAALFRKNKSKAYHHFASAFSECRLFRDGSYFGRTDGKDVHKDANGMIRQEYSTSSTTTNGGDFYHRYRCSPTAQKMLYAHTSQNAFLLHKNGKPIEIKDVRNDFTTKYSQGVSSTGPMDRLTPKIVTVQELSRETSGSISTITTLSPQVHILDQLPFSSILASVMLKDTRKNTNPNDSAFRVFLYFPNDPEYLLRFSSHMQFTLYGRQSTAANSVAFRKKTWNLGDVFQSAKPVTLRDSTGKIKSWLRVSLEMTIPKHSRFHDQLTQVFFLLSNGNPDGFSKNINPKDWLGNVVAKPQNILIGMRMEIAPLKPCPNGKKRTHDGKCGCISDPEHRGFYRTCPAGLVSKVTQAPSLPGSNAPGVYTCSCVPKCKGDEQWLGFKNYQCGICPAGQFNPNFSVSTNSKVDFDQVGVCLSCESRIPSSSLVWKPTSSKVSCGQSDPKIHGQCEAHCECQAPFKLKTIDGVKVCVPPCLAGDIWDPKKRKCVPCGPKQTSNERRNKCTNCQPQEPNEWDMTFFVVDEKGRRCVRIATYPPCNRSTWYYDVHTRKCESCPSGGAKNDTLTNDIDGFKRYTQCQCPCDNLKVVTKDGHCSAPGPGLDPYCCPAEHQYNWANKQCAPCHESYHKPTHPGGAYCVPRCDYSNKGLVWDSESKTCVCHDKSKEIVNGACVPKCKNDEVRVNGACVCPTGQIKINGICEEKCLSAQVKVEAKCYWPVGLGHESVRWDSNGAPPGGSYLALNKPGFQIVCLVGFTFNGFGLCKATSGPQYPTTSVDCPNATNAEKILSATSVCYCPSGSQYVKVSGKHLCR